MPVILQTPRLTLRQFSIDDAPFILQLLNSPGWLQFIGDRGIKTLSDAQSYLVNGPLATYVNQGYGLYMVELTANGQPIGMCGLLKRDYLEYTDIGYALLDEHQGKGYALEIAQAIVEYAFFQLKLPQLAAITLGDNTRSVSLLYKLGFQENGTITVAGKELLLFTKDARTEK